MRRMFPAALCALALSGCISAYEAYPPVPAPQAERVPAPPRSRVALIWRPGHYDWDGAGFAWAPGQWVDRAGHGTLWQDGYWRRGGEGYAWVSGHWM